MILLDVLIFWNITVILFYFRGVPQLDGPSILVSLLPSVCTPTLISSEPHVFHSPLRGYCLTFRFIINPAEVGVGGLVTLTPVPISIYLLFFWRYHVTEESNVPYCGVASTHRHSTGAVGAH